MDKVTCLSYVLYEFSNSAAIQEKAIQLLNGDISLHDLKKDKQVLSELTSAETFLKKNKLDKNLLQDFAVKFLLIEA